MKKMFKKIVKSRAFSLIGILLFIGGCIGIGALAAYINHESDPTEQAVAYFRAFVQQDYEKMYSCLDIADGYYIDKNIYIENMKKTRSNMTIDSYEIKDAEKVDGAKQVTIKCMNSEKEETTDFVIRFTAKRKGLRIIPDYYVNIEDMFVDNFSVVMNKGDYLELNGEKISDDAAEITTDENGNTSYEIKGILKGEYKVSATNEFGAIAQTVKVEKKDTKVELTEGDYTANDKYAKLITEDGENTIDRFYKAVRERNPEYKKLIKCFDNDDKLIEKVKAYVQESQEIVYWPETENIEDYTVTEMNMSELKLDVKYNFKKNTYKVVYKYSYDYVSATDTALYTSYVYDLSGKCESEITFTYTIKDGEIVLTDMKMTNKNHKNEKDGE